MAEYIDRENYCKNICRCPGTECDKSKCPIWTAPAAYVAPVVHGEWIFVDYDETGYQVKCSHCGTEFTFPTKKHLTKHCPNCGAKMDGGTK